MNRRRLLLTAGAIAAPYIIPARAQIPMTGGGKGAMPGNIQIGGVVQGFNPTSLITGNGGFWRADAGVTLSGSDVTAWADQSSFASNLAAAATKPTFSATGFNSASPGITWTDNSGKQLNITLNYASATTSAFFLIQFGSGNALGFGRFLNFQASGQGDFNGANSFTIEDGAAANAADLVANNGVAAGPALTGASLYLLGVVFDGVNANIWSAGAVVGSGIPFSANIGTGAGGLFTLGADSNSNSAGYTLAFAGFTQKAMNVTDWTNLKNWSNANWGTAF